MVPSELYIKNGRRAVILFHAYTGSPNDVRMLARYLEKRDYTVLAPLFSGHGTIDPMDIVTISPLTWLEDAKKAVNRLRTDGYTDIAVFGLSLGGIYAMTLLEKYPDFFVGGGAFCSPLSPDASNHIYPNFLNYCHLMYKKTSDSEKEILNKINRIKGPLKIQLTNLSDLSNKVYEQANLIKKPVFLAQAANDEMIEADGVYEIGKALNKTHHEIHWYKNSSHVITVSGDRHLFEANVDDFLSRIKWNEE